MTQESSSGKTTPGAVVETGMIPNVHEHSGVKMVLLVLEISCQPGCMSPAIIAAQVEGKAKPEICYLIVD